MAISKITSASLDQSAGAPSWDTSGNTTLTGNLTISGTGKRITGDFDNATISNRVLFQTSTTNGQSNLSIIPNGTSNSTWIAAFNNSSPANSSYIQIGFPVTGTEARLATGITGTGTYLPLTMYIGGSERLRIDTSGNVGIGTSSPSRKLTISGAGAFSASTGASIRLDNSTTGRFAIIDNDDSNYLNFWAGADDGVVRFINGTGNGTERVRIDAAGNVGIRTTPSAWISAYPAIDMGTMTGIYGRTDLTPEFATSLNGYRSASGDWLYKTNNPASRHTQGYGYHVFDSASSGTAGNVISFTTVLSVKKDETVSLQGSTSVAGTGITFPATQNASSNANTLDDYEEGTWTPSLGGTATYTVRDAHYTKIGRVVTVNCVLIVNTIGTGSQNPITGLPFAATSNSQGSVSYWGGLSQSFVFLAPFVDTNGTTTVYWKNATTATTGTQNGNLFQNGSRVDFTMTYFTS